MQIVLNEIIQKMRIFCDGHEKQEGAKETIYPRFQLYAELPQESACFGDGTKYLENKSS